MEFKEVFEKEIAKYGLKVCRGGCESSSNHKRGFVRRADRKTVHIDREFATRSTLHRGLHEIGHCINDERGLRSYECEALAEKYATDTMREYGITVPRDVVARGVAYVARKKRHGDRIKANR